MKRYSVLCWLMLGWIPLAAGQHEVLELNAEQRAALAIETYTVGEMASELSAPVVATLVLDNSHQRVLTLPVSGTVEQLAVLPGAVVAAGSDLGLYHSREALALQREYLGAIGALDRSRASKSRDDALYQGGAISKKRWQQTVADWSQREALVKEMSSQLAALGLDAADIKRLRESQEIRGELPLRAPIGGVVMEQRLQTGEAFTAGQELFHIGDVNRLWLSLRVPPALAAAVRTGDSVTLQQSAFASVLQVGAAVDPESQSVQVTAQVTSLPESMLPGQSLLVRLQLQNRSGFLLPRDSLVNVGGNRVVFIAEGSHRFVMRAVEVAPAAAGWIALSGVNEGEQLVVSGVAALKGAALGLGGVAEHGH